VPAALSTTAGTYVCNALLYRAAVGLDVPVGFVHLPCLPEEAGGADLPTMAVEVAARGVAVALATVAEHLGR
jgi:pyroglutamyl-peptidase